MIAKLGIGAALVSLGKQSIEYASDIQEVQNVVDTAFGSMSYKAEEFVKNSIKQFGMSELSAKRTASTYMAMAKGMGIGEETASNMAINLAGLTGDVASFFNISQQVADTKLKSVFTGETESLKELGIVMTQTNLQQYALSQGISKNISDMTQAELTTLRYNYVLNQLNMAQGDFAKTSGSWANQLRILQEQWGQLLGIIGNGLVTVLTPVIQILNKIIEKVIMFANVLSQVLNGLFGGKSTANNNSLSSISKDADNASDSVAGIGTAFDNATSKAKKAAKDIKGVLAPFDDLNILSSSTNSTNSTANTSNADSGAVNIPSVEWENAFSEPDTSGVNNAVEKVMGYITRLKKFILDNSPIILSLLAGLLGGFLAFDTIKFAPLLFSGISSFITLLTEWQLGLGATIQVLIGMTAPVLSVVAAVTAVTTAITYLYQTSESFRSLINEAVGNLLNILSNLYKSCIQPIFDCLYKLYEKILKPLALLISDVFVTTIDALGSIVLSLWNNIFVPFVNFIINILGTAIQGVCDILEGWMPVIEDLIGFLNKLWKEVLKPVAEFIKKGFCGAFSEAKKILVPILGEIEELFSGFVDIIVGLLTLDPSKIEKGWDKVIGVFKNVYDLIYGIFHGIGDWFLQQFNGASEAIANTLSFIKNIPDKITMKVTALKEKAFDTVKSAWDSMKDKTASFKAKVATTWSDLKSKYKSLKDNFKDRTADFKVKLSTIVGNVKNFINSIIKSVNKNIIAKLDFSIKVPDWLGGGKWGWKAPRIPQLAYGGVVNKATLGVFGEAGTEAVIPLKNNTEGLNLIASLLAERMPQSDGGGTYIIQLVTETGEVLTQKIIKNIKDYEKRTGRPAF